MIGGQVVVSQGEGVESQLDHQLYLLDEIFHDCPAVHAKGIAGRQRHADLHIGDTSWVRQPNESTVPGCKKGSGRGL